MTLDGREKLKMGTNVLREQIKDISAYRIKNGMDCSLSSCSEISIWQLVAKLEDKSLIRRGSCDEHLASNFQLIREGDGDCRYTRAMMES